MNNFNKKIHIRSLKYIGAILTVGFVLFIGTYYYLPKIATVTHAADAATWKAGEIADDGVFFDGGDLTVTQIQQFIDQRINANGGCDTNGTRTSELGGGTRAQYGIAHGNPPPYICLNGYYENTTTHTNNLSTNVIPSGAISAAQIIENASVTYNISAKALIVMIEKESPGPLLDDTWPFPAQYTNAMGYGCPDTAPCDPQYAGFYNQIMNAARQFQLYANNPTSYRHKANQNNDILYSPISGCGSSSVYITNQTTAGLYNYTPYQPNQAALNNLYGTGDGCSAYGNRNFWRLFTDWFGTTYSSAYSAKPLTQTPNPTIYTGDAKPVYMTFKNMGSANWYDDTSVPIGQYPVHLAASDPINRSSIFGYGWPSGGRPGIAFSAVYESDGVTLATNQHVVAPGQIAKWTFNLSVPWTLSQGDYYEAFQVVLEGSPNWSMGGLAWFNINVRPTYQATFVSQCSKTTTVQNSTSPCFIKYKNNGNAVWYDDTSVPAGQNPVHLAASSPINRLSPFGSDWVNPGRPAINFSKVYESDGVTLATNQHQVQVGQIVEFDFNLTTTDNINSGQYEESFQPILEGSPAWSMGGVTRLDLSVQKASNSASFVSQSAYPTTQPGIAAPVYFNFKNTGNTSWRDDSSATNGILPIHLAVTNPINHSSIFGYGWPSGGRPNVLFSKVFESDNSTLATDQHTVDPGQIAQFSFSLSPPWTLPNGMYREYVQLISEGAPNWNVPGSMAWMDLTVKQ